VIRGALPGTKLGRSRSRNPHWNITFFSRRRTVKTAPAVVGRVMPAVR